MKRIAICDDSEIERDNIFSEMLKEYWRTLHRQVEIVEYNNGVSRLIADVEEDECRRLESIFLDIYMTGINGLETASKASETELTAASIVFLTGTAESAPGKL